MLTIIIIIIIIIFIKSRPCYLQWLYRQIILSFYNYMNENLEMLKVQVNGLLPKTKRHIYPLFAPPLLPPQQLGRNERMDHS